MTFAFYFLAFWMVRGAQDRRRMSWAIVIGLLAEAVVTIAYGRNGRGGRAVGSFGQSNELGAFLAMFTAFAAAQLPAARALGGAARAGRGGRRRRLRGGADGLARRRGGAGGGAALRRAAQLARPHAGPARWWW